MTHYSGQVSIEYYPSGEIKSYITMVNDEFLIGGQFVKAAEHTVISFHPNGKLKSLCLAEDTKLTVGRKTKKYRSNEQVEFLEDGSLKTDSSSDKSDSHREYSSAFLDAALRIFGL